MIKALCDGKNRCIPAVRDFQMLQRCSFSVLISWLPVLQHQPTIVDNCIYRWDFCVNNDATLVFR